MKQEKITIFGSGNVASHLLRVLSKLDCELALYGRNQQQVSELASNYGIKAFSTPEEIPTDQLIILCVSDRIVAELEAKLNPENDLVYTSGSVSLNSLSQRKNKGVFYPLQTLSQDLEVDFSEVPILIEANNDPFRMRIEQLALRISNRVEYTDSEKRRQLHLAAVMVNNFTNHLYHLAKEFLDEHNLDWKLLEPLIKESTRKLNFGIPHDLQTGPARRNDQDTILSHLAMLNGRKREIYQLLSDSIIETYQTDEKL